jgi:hypothetical protein
VGFVVGKMALGQIFFFKNTSVLPCQYHSTNAPYSLTQRYSVKYILAIETVFKSDTSKMAVRILLCIDLSGSCVSVLVFVLFKKCCV